MFSQAQGKIMFSTIFNNTFWIINLGKPFFSFYVTFIKGPYSSAQNKVRPLIVWPTPTQLDHCTFSHKPPIHIHKQVH